MAIAIVTTTTRRPRGCNVAAAPRPCIRARVRA
jgi:hypothetical protein